MYMYIYIYIYIYTYIYIYPGKGFGGLLDRPGPGSGRSGPQRSGNRRPEYGFRRPGNFRSNNVG